MLNESMVFATIAVRDINAGKQFYGETLGLKQTDENPGGVMYESGGGKVFVYQSPTAGSGQATSAAWQVASVEAVVEDLRSKGVTFEHFDAGMGTWSGDILDMNGMKAAWFKDPDGNTLSVASR